MEIRDFVHLGSVSVLIRGVASISGAGFLVLTCEIMPTNAQGRIICKGRLTKYCNGKEKVKGFHIKSYIVYTQQTSWKNAEIPKTASCATNLLYPIVVSGQ